MRQLLLGTALATFLCVGVAYANWTYSKWGMTPKQVMAASNGTASFKREGSGFHSSQVTGDLKVPGGLAKERFFFEKNKLISVEGAASGDACRGLMTVFSTKYGNSQRYNSLNGDPMKQWEVDGDDLHFTQHGTECSFDITDQSNE